MSIDPPPLTLSKRDARRVAIIGQWLQAPRPTDLVALVQRLTLLQLEPTAAVAPSAQLVCWSRLGQRFRPTDLDDALARGDLVEFRGNVRPMSDMVLFRAEMAAWRTDDHQGWQQRLSDWVAANDSCRRNILHLLDDEGPLRTRDLPDTCDIPWQSSGWNDNRNVRMLLDLMVQRGEVAVAGRRGAEQLWDLAERVYPDDPVVPRQQAEQGRDARRLRALGIARSRGPQCPTEPLDVGAAGVPAVVDGVPGLWRVDPALLDEPFRGRAALLSPFDRLIQDRKRMAELFEYDYILEMYKPAAKRRWGYYALPVLYGDRLVGKLDAKAQHADGVLRVNALHWDVTPTAAMAAAVDREINGLARWLSLERVNG